MKKACATFVDFIVGSFRPVTVLRGLSIIRTPWNAVPPLQLRDELLVLVDQLLILQKRVLFLQKLFHLLLCLRNRTTRGVVFSLLNIMFAIPDWHRYTCSSISQLVKGLPRTRFCCDSWGTYILSCFLSWLIIHMWCIRQKNTPATTKQYKT